MGNRVINYSIRPNSRLWTVYLDSEVIDIQTVDKWVIAMTAGKLWQIGPQNFLMSTILISPNYTKMGIVRLNNKIQMAVWSVGGSIVELFQVEDEYLCDASQGCQCIIEYCFTNFSKVLCNYTGPTTCPDISQAP